MSEHGITKAALLQAGAGHGTPPAAGLGPVAFLTLVVLGLWAFPTFWYTQTDPRTGHFWLTEQTNLTQWAFREIPVSKSAEALLVADRLISGEFDDGHDHVVRVFSAKRYAESGNEIGLFVHTPDRCWTESGWKMQPVQPEYKSLTVHGVELLFERRVFTSGAQPELVYFAGLVGGQPLPYRLDHNLSVGMKHALHTAQDSTGTTLRASDKRFWQRVWDSFVARRPLIGPKQFLRISTPVHHGDVEAADMVLESFLPQWLATSDYRQELVDWSRRKPNHDKRAVRSPAAPKRGG
jgi:hypothetical protein